MFTKKKLDIAKRIAAINYILENKPLDNDVECDMKIIDIIKRRTKIVGISKTKLTLRKLCGARSANILKKRTGGTVPLAAD